MTPPRSWDNLRLATLELLIDENYALLREMPVNNNCKKEICHRLKHYFQEYQERAGRPYVPKSVTQRYTDGFEGDLENQ